jgi:hypothetical protein
MTKTFKCGTPGCSNDKRRRAVFCSACWSQIPESHQKTIRDKAKEADSSLRANPSKEWMSQALKHTMSRLRKAVAA